MISSDLNLSKNEITLLPLEEHHQAPLTLAAQDPRIWDYLRMDLHRPEIFREKWWSKAFSQKEKGTRFPFVITLKNEIIGSSSFYHMDPAYRTLCIGYTWFHPQFWKTRTNPTTKFLMLSHAFESLKCIRVFFEVDCTNHRSQGAVTKLGALREGTLRNHMIRADGSYRDTVVFSIIESEWPQVKEKLLTRI